MTRPRRRNMATGAALAALLLLGACSGKEAPPPPEPTVTVATPLVENIVDSDEYIGRFEAIESVDLRPRISGQLESVSFREGDLVQKGQPLYRIDPRPFEAALAEAKGQVFRAKAALLLANENFRRTEKLWKANAVSREEFDSARATRDGANADLAAAEATQRSRALDVNFTSVRAPVAGRISYTRLTAGNFVTAGTTLLTTIVSVSPIYFTFTGSEAFYLKYESGARGRMRGNPVEIRLQGEDDYRHHGRLDFIDNAIDTSSGTFRARAILDNRNGFLTPGLFGQIRVLGTKPHQALLVPDSAIGNDQEDKILMVVGKDDKVVPHRIVPGPLYGNLRVILSGISEGDRVIINGGIHARPGVKVKVEKGRILPTDMLPGVAAEAPAKVVASGVAPVAASGADAPVAG